MPGQNSNPVPPVFNLPFVSPGNGLLTPQALQFLQLLWSGPAGTSGVFGPPTSVVGDVALWANTTGSLLADGGTPSDFVFAELEVQLVPGSNITITPGGGNTLIIAAGAASGDVVGPSSAINGGFALFDGTTGKLLKSGVVGPGNLAFLNTITASLVTNFFTTVLADVTSILVAGLGITITPSGASLIITAAGSTPVDYWGAYENNIRVANSASVNSTNLNNLIAAVSGGGGGRIWFNEGAGYQFSSTIVLASTVSLEGTGGVFEWKGSTSGDVFASPSTAVLFQCNLTNIIVDEGAGFTGNVLNLHSHMFCVFDVLGIGTAGTGVFCNNKSDSSAGVGPAGNRNTAFNTYKLRHQGVCLHFCLVEGIPTGFGGQAQVVTDNTFENCQASNVNGIGFRFEAWADTNTMSGATYAGIVGLNGIGFILNQGNSGTPSVYNMNIEHLAIDTFGTGLNRFGMVLNNSKAIYWGAYFNLPNAENGSFVGTNCLSYLGNETLGTNAIYQHQKNFSVGP